MNEKVKLPEIRLPNIWEFGQFSRAVFKLLTPSNISSQKRPEAGYEVGKFLFLKARAVFKLLTPSNISSQKKPEVDS